MPNLRKTWWAFRALVLSPTFGRLKMPSYLGPTTFVLGSRKIFIDRRVRIFPGLRAETHANGRLFIHEDVTIGQNFLVTCMGDLHIGSGTTISGGVLVTDIDHEYRDVNLPVHKQPMIYSRSELGRNCFVGMGARLQAGTVLGDGCIVGSNAVVRGTFPPHSVLAGVPARIVKRYNPETEKWDRVSR